MTDSSLRPILIIRSDGFAAWETPLIAAAAPGTAPVGFAARVLRAAGVPDTTVPQVTAMITAEHSA